MNPLAAGLALLDTNAAAVMGCVNALLLARLIGSTTVNRKPVTPGTVIDTLYVPGSA
ncbi:MAG TPA: hypothetical protein VF748_10080 [Candidatus Acidoferrum sp.]